MFRRDPSSPSFVAIACDYSPPVGKKAKKALSLSDVSLYDLKARLDSSFLPIIAIFKVGAGITPFSTIAYRNVEVC